MTESLRVDPAAVQRLAEEIRRAAAEARAVTSDPRPLDARVAALAAPCLVRATGAFLAGWRTSLADLVDDATRLADVVALIGRGYEDAEAANARILRPGTDR